MRMLARIFVPTLVAFLVGVGVAAFVSSSLLVAGFLLLVAATLLTMTMRYQNKFRLLADARILRGSAAEMNGAIYRVTAEPSLLPEKTPRCRPRMPRPSGARIDGRTFLLLFGICALAAALGMLRFMLWADVPNNPVLQSALGKTVVLRGVIGDEPDVRETNTQLTFTANELSGGSNFTPVDGKVLLIVDRYPEYEYGDAIEIRGLLKKPESFNEDDGRVFDYPNYLKAKGIAYQIFRPQIVVLKHDQGNFIEAKLFAAKHAFLGRLSSALPEPENALAGGILLGGKRSLSAEWTDRFRAVGIVHIIVLSGYNMTIVAEWLGAGFLFLGFYGSLAISAVGIVLFALMTGAGATVLRAAIMALLVLLARLTGSTATMGRALLVAGVAMVLQNPSVIAFDPSFQLSFLAALGLVFVAPLLRERIKIFRTHHAIEEVVISTLATQIMVLPLLIHQTGIFSTVALFANLLVLPLIPVAMLFSFATGLLAFLGNIFAFLPALPTEAFLAWILAVGKYGASLPFAAMHLPPIPGWLVFLAYAVIAWFIYRSSRPASPTPLPQDP